MRVGPVPLRASADLHSPNRFRDIEDCDRLLVIGTTLATYSAFRTVKHALELKKPVFVLNTGPTRADELPGIEKVDGLSGSVLPEAVRTILWVARVVAATCCIDALVH